MLPHKYGSVMLRRTCSLDILLSQEYVRKANNSYIRRYSNGNITSTISALENHFSNFEAGNGIKKFTFFLSAYSINAKLEKTEQMIRNIWGNQTRWNFWDSKSRLFVENWLNPVGCWPFWTIKLERENELLKK